MKTETKQVAGTIPAYQRDGKSGHAVRIFVMFIYAVLAGASIGLGGTAFLSIENKVVGALIFSLGLFFVCTNGFLLFTGKVCYVFERGPGYLLDLAIFWLGNLGGAFLVGTIVRSTRLISLSERALQIAQVKLDDSLWSIFLLAVLCNVLIFLAVDGYGRNPHELGKYMALVYGVVGFIVCGTEHCVANMFYFTAAGAWSWNTLLYVLVMTAGNSVGGFAIPLLRMLKEKHPF
jgi:formate/nitrite transporter FocA (FNT family)